ncbi:hypothetical protein BMF94_2149 [Rhodotorula taiwanensis]|uniref:Uncharacterized protein n=1 Tax=Rhodotorula taiwanensis TaxID=741276 RepID=A0A2S5BDL9_9BASI|nr:hypothetical protein BMF94_2149 [Rhodotorula taiwanensis]
MANDLVRSAVQSMSGLGSSSGTASPWDTPLATPHESPATTPGGSPIVRDSDGKRLPKMSDIKMILSDVDGTLFTDAHELHPATTDAIRYIRKNHPDVPFIPVTGKQLSSCRDLIKELDLADMPAGCMHGAIIYDHKHQIEQQMYLDPHFVRDVARLMRKHNKSTFLYVEEWNAMVTKEENGTKDWEQVARGFDPAVRDERETDFMQRVLKGKERIYKIFLPMDEEVVPQFLELIEKSFPDVAFKTTRALPYIIEIVAEGVDKSAALAYFCAKFNVKAENVITFGDGENDVGMFEAAGYSVAMANGMKKPKRVATHQTSSNDDGGVGKFLNKIFRPEMSDEPDARLSVDHLKQLDQQLAANSPLAAGAYP